jgi:hypothetical protein
MPDRFRIEHTLDVLLLMIPELLRIPQRAAAHAFHTAPTLLRIDPDHPRGASWFRRRARTDLAKSVTKDHRQLLEGILLVLPLTPVPLAHDTDHSIVPPFPVESGEQALFLIPADRP